MEISSPKLLIEINMNEFIFLILESDKNESFKIINKYSLPIQGINNKKIQDYNLILNLFKKKIYSIEQEKNFVFNEATIIINNFDCSVINFTGFKKLNGSQLEKENVTYIINSLKTKINEIENHKTILHIFNSKFFLDKKIVNNIPIGLFGDFYSHELSFFLINVNDLKNLQNIFKKCNLKVKKIISKSFVEGASLINNYPELDTFIKIEINEKNSHIFFFDNDTLKFFQDFSFGTDIIISDISKITSLDEKIIKKILSNPDFFKEKFIEELVEKEFFQEKNFRKIKKKLIKDIASARIQEMAELMIFKNINLKSFLRSNILIFLEINDKINLKSMKDVFTFHFSKNNFYKIKPVNFSISENFYERAYKIAHIGWNKEAIPITQNKHSLITRIFKSFFG